jgi:glutamate 5-kinase
MKKIDFRTPVTSVRTVVVKVGSRILASPESQSHAQRIGSLVSDLVEMRSAGLRVILVTSGAIAQGVQALHLSERPRAIPLKQACASIGQIRLMHIYESLFAQHGIPIGQVLLTWDDLRDKKRYLNLRNTLFQLLDCEAIPILNENDSVGIEEIRFGDNDTLGAQVAMLVGADLFVILTDIPGLYDANPQKARASHIPLIEKITPAIHAYADEKGNAVGVGGMVTKLKAAEMVTKAGIYALIGDGYHERLLTVLKSDRAASLFLPSEKKMSSRSRWIAFSGKTRGVLSVDDGARKAVIKKGTSLLPAGIKKVTGSFTTGDMVDIRDESGKTFAKGIVNYSSSDIAGIMGCRTSEIASLLGRKTFDEVVHRNNLVTLE